MEDGRTEKREDREDKLVLELYAKIDLGQYATCLRRRTRDTKSMAKVDFDMTSRVVL